MPKLSDLQPEDIQILGEEVESAKPLKAGGGKLSDLAMEDIQILGEESEPSAQEEPGLLPSSMGEAASRVGAGLKKAKDVLLNPLSVFKSAGEQLGTELATPGAGQATAVHAGQGATLGFGEELSAGVSAAAGEDYKKTRNRMRQEIDETAQSHPMLSALSEIAGGIPLTIATGGASVGRPILAAAINTGLAGAYGLGASKKNSLGEAATDTIKPALFAGGLSALANSKALTNTVKNNYKTYFNPELGKEVVDTVNVNNIPVVKGVDNGALEIQFPSEGKKLKTAFKLGKEEARSLATPEMQAKITDEVTHIFGNDTVEGTFPKIIADTQSDLGLARDKILNSIGSNPLKTGSMLNESIDDIAKIQTGGLARDVKPAQADFTKEIITPMWKKFQSSSPTQNLDDVPLSAILEEKQALGKRLFGKEQLFHKTPAVREKTIKLYNNMNKLLNGHNNDLKLFNDAFDATYQMEDNVIKSYSKLNNLSDPNAGSARLAYETLIKPFQKLPENMRAALLPKIQNYLSKDMPATLLKSDIKNAAVKTVKADGIYEWALNKLMFTQGGRISTASSLGAAVGKAGNAVQSTANLGKAGLATIGDAVVGGDNSLAGQAARIPSLTGAMSIGDEESRRGQ